MGGGTASKWIFDPDDADFSNAELFSIAADGKSAVININWTTYPTSDIQVHMILRRNNSAGGSDIFGNTITDLNLLTACGSSGGANFLFVTKDGKVVTPKSNTILPSITRRSLMYVAKEYLGLEVEERQVALSELKDMAECGLCGTAAVISPVGKVVDHGEEICFPSGMSEMGPVTKKLYDTLTGIQMGRIEAPEGWIKVIK